KDEELGEFTKGGEDGTIPGDMIEYQMVETRHVRSITSPDDDVKVIEANPKIINAKVRDYTLKMDMGSKTILHDCGDWERSIETRQLCKHIGKVLLTVPEDTALAWVSAIQENLEAW